jgi:FolB domain-containing protein
MTLLLASVNGPAEAEIALAGGADIVDMKDASQGALGALSPGLVRATRDAVRGRRPVSAVTGDLPMRSDIIQNAVAEMAATGVDYVKVGLFPDAQREDCIRALSSLAQKTKIVGVLFADLEPDHTLLKLMAECGFAGAMLDTARKSEGRLLDRMDIPALGDFVALCRRHHLMSGLAGSLETPDIPRLLVLAPDFLGFRGALCAGRDRAAHIDPDAVVLVRELIPPDVRSEARAGEADAAVDYRLLAARGYFVDPDDAHATDCIFVRDFLLPVRIGAYAHERAKPQNVRFNVEAKVLRSGRAAADMRDVFSYDVIMDGIRMIVAHEHIALVETLAERIASLVLANDRVVDVRVRVEKLDIGPAGVGVEIRRERAAEMAQTRRFYPSGGSNGQKAAE